LTANVAVGASATTGAHIVLITATAGQSLAINLGVNTISVQ
jgi:hypothetical protein